ncbi:DC-STAMP domain-containing protein 2 [Dendropsophus ebraccatus]|uniref:DC-STAMP domain-containing protein 2 n=1 Tax=Dendropsophus ebraccatus TaxID=150705 RepID=UPI00383175B5
MGTRIGPGAWLCGWCKHFCSLCKCDCRSPCPVCSCCTCQCTCLPLLCPPPEERLKVEEVSAADYIDADRIIKARIRKDSPTKAVLRSFAGFTVGILLTIFYAYMVLFVKNYNLWFCLATTIAIGGFLALGMAFSKKIRITVLLMLPEIFSSEAKTIILFIAFSMVLNGPTANLVGNGKRSMQSMACGAQLALNETKELFLKFTDPILGALTSVENIGGKIRLGSQEILKLFHKMIEGAKHAGKVLRGIWRFIANIGDICNEELERPYKRCNRLFDEAKNNCFKVMSFMGFVCYILDAFKPLCGLAKILVALCAIPDFVQTLVRKHIRNPVLSAVRDFKDQFDFNITVAFDSASGTNASRHFFDVAADIIKDLKGDVEYYMEIVNMFSYSMLFVCVFTYVQALRYRKNYLFDLNHDNIYITRDFIELDVMRAKQNRNTLLPLSSGEAYDFIRPASLSLTKKEKKGYTFAIFNVLRSLLVALLAIIVDYILYWFLDFVDHLMRGEIVTRAPMILSLLVNGTGLAEEIFTTLASSFDALQKSNITIHTRKCQVRPTAPNYLEYGLIGALHGAAFGIAILGIYMQRVRRYICAYYYPTLEQKRICYLYNNLLTKRSNLEKALYEGIRKASADRGHINILLILAAKCPFLFGWLANRFVTIEEYCMGCAQVITGKNIEGYYACSTFGCKGKYCGGCSKILNNACILCMAPLVCNEINDEEIDSSDDEQIALWMEAAKSMGKGEKTKKKKMKKVIKSRLKETFKRKGKNDQLIQKYKESMMPSDSEDGFGLSDLETGEDSEESDFEYQASPVNDATYKGWTSIGEGGAGVISQANVQGTTGGRRRNWKERDVEKVLVQ